MSTYAISRSTVSARPPTAGSSSALRRPTATRRPIPSCAAGIRHSSQAVLAGASGQLRNMATIGGNLLQRTRCAYFADPSSACNKRLPGSGCSAIAGEHHNHAILGWSNHCVATHPSDMTVALAAFDAIVHYETLDGAHEIPLTEFYLPVGDSPDKETALPPGALITAVDPAGSPRPRVRDTARSASVRPTPSPTCRRSRVGRAGGHRSKGADRSRRPRLTSLACPRCRVALLEPPRPPTRFRAAADAELRRRAAARQRLQGHAGPQPHRGHPDRARAPALVTNPGHALKEIHHDHAFSTYPVPDARPPRWSTCTNGLTVGAIGARTAPHRGPAKVTGRVRYAADQPMSGPGLWLGRHLHGVPRTHPRHRHLRRPGHCQACWA